MAEELKINDYTAASAIENTTSFIAQTVSNTTQRVPLSVIKDNIANEFMKNAELIYDNPNRSTQDQTPISLSSNTEAGDVLAIVCSAKYLANPEDPTGHLTLAGEQTVFMSKLDGNIDYIMYVTVQELSESTFDSVPVTLSETNTLWCTNNELTIYQVYKIKLGA